MGTIQEKIKYLGDTKVMIRDSIIKKGIEVLPTTPFRQYVEMLKDLGTLPKLKQAELRLSIGKEVEYLDENTSGGILSFATKIHDFNAERTRRFKLFILWYVSFGRIKNF